VINRKEWEFIAVISAYCDHLLQDQKSISDQNIYRYWNLSRQHTQYTLQQLGKHSPVTAPLAPEALREFLELISTELHLEMRNRVWCAILTANDQIRKSVHSEPMARGIMSSQLRIRHDVLEKMVELSDHHLEELTQLNHLRLTIEHQTDMILGHLLAQYDLHDFAHDASRALRYGVSDLHSQLQTADYSPWEAIQQGGEFLAWMESVHLDTPGKWDPQLKGAILRCFPDSAFNSMGTFRAVIKRNAPVLQSTK
jgi:hypothetical protein